MSRNIEDTYIWNKWKWLFEEKQEEPIEPIKSRCEILDLRGHSPIDSDRPIERE